MSEVSCLLSGRALSALPTGQAVQGFRTSLRFVPAFQAALSILHAGILLRIKIFMLYINYQFKDDSLYCLEKAKYEKFIQSLKYNLELD